MLMMQWTTRGTDDDHVAHCFFCVEDASTFSLRGMTTKRATLHDIVHRASAAVLMLMCAEQCCR
jgi:hypothetical protein